MFGHENELKPKINKKLFERHLVEIMFVSYRRVPPQMFTSAAIQV